MGAGHRLLSFLSWEPSAEWPATNPTIWRTNATDAGSPGYRISAFVRWATLPAECLLCVEGKGGALASTTAAGGWHVPCHGIAEGRVAQREDRDRRVSRVDVPLT